MPYSAVPPSSRRTARAAPERPGRGRTGVLARRITAALAAAGHTVAVAESLTAGRLATALADAPGAGRTFLGAVVAYDTRLKATLLRVDPVLLAERGAVDPDVAAQMAHGARVLTGATYALATTGVAGPAPQDGRPVGTVHLAAATPARTVVTAPSSPHPNRRRAAARPSRTAPSWPRSNSSTTSCGPPPPGPGRGEPREAAPARGSRAGAGAVGRRRSGPVGSCSAHVAHSGSPTLRPMQGRPTSGAPPPASQEGRMSPSPRVRPLAVYLNDHLTGATAGVALARRTAGSHTTGSRAGALRELADDIARDRDALLRIMRCLGVPVRRYRTWLGLAAERAGRLKPNGTLVRRAPLSDLVELETLRTGVEGKAALWRALLAIAEQEPRLRAPELERLAERARDQARLLDGWHHAASTQVLPPDPRRTASAG
ncbi:MULTISPECIES: CinA family protein [Kitasatospora]|uniref:CinA C-terminal domain-containing protein n=1 Tax=Kitasatospora setae (strain ATCC 33774 / DSM 43861 / JCM 3304 / KCC A-0304 / NBRC 14216 / KM-6054) TaxID=452652 RepID=E4NA41_KITSK|nr:MULTISPECIES: CinA family protein [Kitasatospora]BAJ28072.1 hypothetical protein KSE_22520 [Kitasatospora setae KM-6054]